MAGLNAQAKAWAYLRNKGKSKVKKQQQIPFGNDKQKGQIRRFWLRQNDERTTHNSQLITALPAGVVGGGAGVGGEPLVEGDGEGEEFLFAVEGVNHLDVELGALEGRVVEALDVVEEVAGKCGVGLDDGGLEAEVVVVLGDLLVDGSALDGEGVEWNADGLGAVQGEEAAVDLVLGGGGEGLVGGGDELDACIVELKGAVAVVGDDDADGQEAVLDVWQTEEGALVGVVAGVGGDGDTLVGVGVVGGVVGGGLGWRGGALTGGAGGEGCEAEEGGYDSERS